MAKLSIFISLLLLLLLSPIANTQAQVDLARFADMPFADGKRKVPPFQVAEIESVYKSLGQPSHRQTKKFSRSDDPKDIQTTLEYPDTVVVYLFSNAQKQYWRIGWQLKIKDMKLSEGFHYGMTETEITTLLGKPMWVADSKGGKEILYGTGTGDNVGFNFEKGWLIYINITTGM